MADVEEPVAERPLQDSDSLDLTVDNCHQSKCDDISSVTMNSGPTISRINSEGKSVTNSKLPNGIIPCDSNRQTVNCVCNQGEKVQQECSNVSEPAPQICLQDARNQENSKKQNELTDSADSGVHSGTDNSSDVKSSSSSPGLSTESSVQDLCEKNELKKCDSEEPVEITDQPLSSGNDVISELAKSVTNVSLSEDKCDSETVDIENGIEYVVYKSELQMPDIMKLITKDLSEPYSIYTYRYFIHNWPKLCFLAKEKSQCVGAIVCKLDLHKKMVRRGYIAMLAVDQSCRRKGIGSHLVLKAIRAMIADDCDEVVLETEITNKAALRLYENLGFVRDKRLFRYYLNGVDALRLKLWLR